MKKQIEKLAVFDLDDTLYTKNSHYSILHEYYHTNFFYSILFRALNRFFPKIAMDLAYWLYNRIPEDIKENFSLPFRPDVMDLLMQKQYEGYYPIILSNAPIELLKHASELLNLEYYRADAYEKATMLQKCFDYDYLFVCTDNKSDANLIDIADEAILTCKPRIKPFFIKRLKMRNYQFIDEMKG